MEGRKRGRDHDFLLKKRYSDEICSMPGKKRGGKERESLVLAV